MLSGLTHHVPNVLHADLAPCRPNLSFMVQAPDRSDDRLLRVLPNDLANRSTVIAKATEKDEWVALNMSLRIRKHAPSRIDDNIRLELTAVIELQACLGEPLNLGVVLDFDLSIDDLLACASVCSSFREHALDVKIHEHEPK